MPMQSISARPQYFNAFEFAQNPIGRWWLVLRVQWQCWLMRFLAEGGQIAKRALDIIGSGLFILMFSPLFLFIALLVKVDGGPVFFTQTRAGQRGRGFQMYKFRSMRVDAEEQLKKLLALNQHKEGVTFKMKNDPRVTWVGKWLRRFSLDELPQFFNVLKGDMSLVGPRPPTPREVEKYTLADRRRLAVKPGITCVWQVSGRSEIDFSGQVKLDVQYIEMAGFWVDIKILAKTVPAVLTGKGAC
jgi:exopolysaccharide biosynthesis polyprenyl glycosylphosphotransferase